jgi:hypothetical protein
MRQVFIGSSGAGLTVANLIGNHLRENHDVDAIVWDTCFKPGDIPLHKIQRLAESIDAAILVASPDDPILKKGAHARSARDNVIFEYGFFAASLGLSRVALCLFAETSVPTDFDGLTVVKMGAFKPDHGSVPNKARTRLDEWIKNMPPLQSGIPPISRYHGLTGTWTHQIAFRRWRDINLKKGESVYFHGTLVLLLAADGESGSGTVNGRLVVRLRECEADFDISEQIITARVEADGSLRMKAQSSIRHRISLKGKPRQKSGFETYLRDGAYFDFHLFPTDRRNEMEGDYQVKSGKEVRSKGEVSIVKKGAI